jgi:hypothetical protein
VNHVCQLISGPQLSGYGPTLQGPQANKIIENPELIFNVYNTLDPQIFKNLTKSLTVKTSFLRHDL